MILWDGLKFVRKKIEALVIRRPRNKYVKRSLRSNPEGENIHAPCDFSAKGIPRGS